MSEIKDPKSDMKHPMQPIGFDAHGVIRFKPNAIVQYLLDRGPFDMNHLAVQQFGNGDRSQFAQLIGYSVSGWGGLSYVTDEEHAVAHAAAEVVRGREPVSTSVEVEAQPTTRVWELFGGHVRLFDGGAEHTEHWDEEDETWRSGWGRWSIEDICDEDERRYEAWRVSCRARRGRAPSGR